MFSKCSRKGLKLNFVFGYMESQLDSAKRFTVIQTFDSNIPLKCEYSVAASGLVSSSDSKPSRSTGDWH